VERDIKFDINLEGSRFIDVNFSLVSQQNSLGTLCSVSPAVHRTDTGESEIFPSCVTLLSKMPSINITACIQLLDALLQNIIFL